MKDILFFGIQGSGKGTQGTLLAEKKKLVIFETGAQLRVIREENSELGKTVREIMDRGDLVTNEIVMNMVADFLEKNEGKRILFDGIPRSLLQKETFDAVLKKHNRHVHGICFTLEKKEAIARMLGRGRSDDNLETINRRLENYEKETLPVIVAYEQEGKMTTISAHHSIEDIHAMVVECVDVLFNK